MSFYQKLGKIGPKFIRKHTLFKYGFNLSPMYRTSTARLIEVSEDLLKVRVKLPIKYNNRNYVGSIFGGSMFAAVDPIPMVQLINLLDSEFIVWDKSAEIFFRAPAREDLYADFEYTEKELEEIKKSVSEDGELEIVKSTLLTNKSGSKTYCEVKKRVYIATKAYFKKKQEAKKRP